MSALCRKSNCSLTYLRNAENTNCRNIFVSNAVSTWKILFYMFILVSGYSVSFINLPYIAFVNHFSGIWEQFVTTCVAYRMLRVPNTRRYSWSSGENVLRFGVCLLTDSTSASLYLTDVRSAQSGSTCLLFVDNFSFIVVTLSSRFAITFLCLIPVNSIHLHMCAPVYPVQSTSQQVACYPAPFSYCFSLKISNASVFPHI